MKHLKTLLLAITLIFGATSFVNAQSKVGHINFGEVVTSMPEYKAAQAEIEQMGKTYEAEIQASVKELESTLKRFDAEAASQTSEENQKRMQQVESMKQGLGQFQQQAQQDIQNKEIEKMKPIRTKAEAAVKKVAAALGLNYILDSSTLLVATGKDITPDVKKELGI